MSYIPSTSDACITTQKNTRTTSFDFDNLPTVPLRPVSTLPLDMAQHAFDLLMAGPQPLSVDGAEVGAGLPARLISLPELRAILLHPSCPRTTRDQTWKHLISQAREHRKAWMVAAVALALPMLRRLTRALASRITIDREDLEAEILTSYMEAITRVNLTWTHPLLRLSRLTQFAVLRSYAVQRFDLLTEPEHGEGEQALSYPVGHADLLLAEAVGTGVITAEEAELIGLTRLENVQLSVYCRQHNLLYCTMLKRRQRAEAALYRALADGELADIS
ncbi:hypothetical protein [Herbidospora cretacea]|uniref:hypothetical protein n=1 Tax=Herbidospora cretacea TaxID=28444 RepID=UPI000773E8BF|nr:hypothetical protein [Herbidospora cretacea]